MSTQTQTKPDLEPRQERLLQWTEKGFDLRTQIVDPQTGETLRMQPYRRVVDRDQGTYYIRDGKRFSESGVVIGDESVKKAK